MEEVEKGAGNEKDEWEEEIEGEGEGEGVYGEQVQDEIEFYMLVVAIMAERMPELLEEVIYRHQEDSMTIEGDYHEDADYEQIQSEFKELSEAVDNFENDLKHFSTSSRKFFETIAPYVSDLDDRILLGNEYVKFKQMVENLLCFLPYWPNYYDNHLYSQHQDKIEALCYKLIEFVGVSKEERDQLFGLSRKSRFDDDMESTHKS